MGRHHHHAEVDKSLSHNVMVDQIVEHQIERHIGNTARSIAERFARHEACEGRYIE